ncbi:TPA: sensor histidine kinase [Enterococcus faecium]
MKIFVNKNTKRLLLGVISCVLVFFLISVILIGWNVNNYGIYIMISGLCMGLFILLIGYRYFQKQSQMMGNSVDQIRAFISGNEEARIECDDEGDLYLLFHEVNSLVAILSAHMEKEKQAKLFLKNTLLDISHQLKTPLAALNIYNGIIQEETENSAVIKEFTTLSERELDRIEILVQNLLKITKLDAATIRMEKRPENLSEMMNDIVRHYHYRMAQEGKHVSLIGDDRIMIICDSIWMKEAISNIVKNALDHTKKDDTIIIEWRQFASVVQIIIKDSGSGIHPEDLLFIFKRFYRSRFSKDTQGIGLGLPLAKSIIEAHNGTIKVDSELGSGTVFTLDLLIPTKL